MIHEPVPIDPHDVVVEFHSALVTIMEYDKAMDLLQTIEDQPGVTLADFVTSALSLWAEYIAQETRDD